MPRLYPPELADSRGRLDRGALHYAAEAGLAVACKYLVDGLKLDVNAKDYLGFTPLAFSAMKGHTTTSKYQMIVTFLLCILLRRMEGGRRSRKAIEVAAAQGHKEAVEILFPMPKPIDNIEEWSVDGILGDMQPENGRKKACSKLLEAFKFSFWQRFYSSMRGVL